MSDGIYDICGVRPATIRAQVVSMQLERVRRTAQGQGVELVTDQSLVDHLAAAGFRLEFGARELRRLIRTELETQLARAKLADTVHEGDRVLARWDGSQQTVVLEPQPGAAGGESNPAGKRSHRQRSGIEAAQTPTTPGESPAAAE